MLFIVGASSRGQTPIIVTAGLAVALLLVAGAWRLGDIVKIEGEVPLSYERPSTEQVLAARKPLESNRNWQNELAELGIISTSTEGLIATTTLSVADVISDQFLAGYTTLKESGRYTPETASAIGRSIGESVRAPSQFVMHGEGELKKDLDTSSARALEYRADMREALAVLISDAPPEFQTFGLYVETKNPARLLELEEAADRYQKAERALLAVVVPQDAVALHIRAANALGSYADTIRQLIRYADDPLSTLAVLRTYNDTEREMLYAFDALASYYVRKSADN
jgi:hypothetical protein